MSKWIKISLAIMLVFAMTPLASVSAQAITDCTFSGSHSNGATYCITMPTPPPFELWNHDLMIYAHGYVAPTAPLEIPWSQMTFSNGAGGTITLPFLVNNMGFAFATTSYSENGLAVKQGVADILDLISVFKMKVGTPNHIYLVGASEGGLVTTLAMERHPDSFSGGMELCGPVGSFTSQVNYWGDFRVVYDYLMDTPEFDVLPGNAVNIPKSLMMKWDSIYVPRIITTLESNPASAFQLLNVTGAPIDPTIPKTVGETTIGILWYNAFATNDAIDKLGGQPFDNRDRQYSGSINDAMLNAGVKRFRASETALAEIAANYETSGILTKPLVAMHTSGDPIVPAWHLTQYSNKVFGSNPLTPFAPVLIQRYGHCSFTLPEVLGGFSTLVKMVLGAPVFAPSLLDRSVDSGAYLLNK
ncbi:MAG TPA: hypothetical protein VGK00_06395 [Anaerolineales bacterium]